MWRVVVARSDENSTLLSSEITPGGVGGGHISTLTGPATSHHWGYPPPPHHPPYQAAGPQHPDMRHHHDMRGPDLRHPGGGGGGAAIVELRHDMQRTDLRVHQTEMQRPEVRHPEMQRVEVRHPEMQRVEVRHPEMLRSEMNTRQQQQQQQQQQQHQELRHQELGHQPDMSGMRPDLTELRPSHELPELKIDGAELRTRESQQQQQQQQQAQVHQQRNLKRAMSESDGDDVFSEESGKEPCNSPGGDSCQHASRKRRRGMIEKKRRDRINASLGELRRLVPAAARDPHSGKLEKAEILQLTVEHLRTLRNKGPEGYDSTKLAMDYHAVGWGECAAEVGRYLVTMEGLDERDPLRLRLLSHLQSFHREHPPSGAGGPAAPPLPSASSLTSSSTATSYDPPSSGGMGPAPGSMPHLLGGSALGWSQYPGQYPQQQHGKPYRPWGAELAY